MAKRKTKKKGKDILKWPRVILPILFALYLVAFRFVIEPNSESSWTTYFLVENGFLVTLAFCLLMALLSLRRFRFTLIWLLLFGLEGFVAGHPSFGSRPSDSPAKTIKVLTYNVAHFDLDLTQPGILEIMKDSGADLIFIQETCKIDKQKEIGEALCRSLKGFHYVSASSNMILSRYPIKLERFLDVPTKWPVKQFPQAVVQSPLGRLRLMCVHMEPSWVGGFPPNFSEYIPVVSKVVQDRRAQTDLILAALRPSKDPVIMAGDFNGPPGSESIRRINEYFTDSYAATERGFGFTLLPKMPYKRIDYVWTRGLTPLQSQVLSSTASDHMPVLTTLGSADFQPPLKEPPSGRP